MRNPRRARLVVWIVSLTALSFLPFSVKQLIGTTGMFHTAGHFAAFAVTGVLFLQWKRPSVLYVWRIWPVLVFIFLQEWLETVFYKNTFEWRDIKTDALGLLASVLIYVGGVLIRSLGQKHGFDRTP